MWKMNPSSHDQHTGVGPANGGKWDLQSCLIRSERIHWRRLDDEVVLLDLDSGIYSTLNAVGAIIWDRCDGTISVAEIIEEIASEFDVAEEVAQRDTLEFLHDLVERDFVLV